MQFRHFQAQSSFERIKFLNFLFRQNEFTSSKLKSSPLLNAHPSLEDILRLGFSLVATKYSGDKPVDLFPVGHDDSDEKEHSDDFLCIEFDDVGASDMAERFPEDEAVVRASLSNGAASGMASLPRGTSPSIRSSSKAPLPSRKFEFIGSARLPRMSLPFFHNLLLVLQS